MKDSNSKLIVKKYDMYSLVMGVFTLAIIVTMMTAIFTSIT